MNSNNYVEKLSLEVEEGPSKDLQRLKQFKIKTLKNVEEGPSENKSRKDYFQIKKNYHQMEEGLSLDAGIIKKHKFYLVVYAYNLNEVRKKNDLRYFYFDKPPLAEKLFQKDLAEDFQRFRQKVIERFTFNVQQIFVFLKGGRQVFSFLEIPDEEQTIFVSTKPLYNGIYNLCYNKVKQ